MILRIIVPLAALSAAVALAGCEANGAMGGPETSVAQAAAPTSQFRLPPAAPCSGEISRYEAVVRDDLSTGNVEQKVYDQIQKELTHAAAACSAGRGGEAHAIVASSKAKHGYRA